jgi:hypothetical protein
VRKREIPRQSPQWFAVENALDRMPDPETMTPEERRRARAVLNKTSELATRRKVALHVRVWLDEHRDSLSTYGRAKAS